MSILRQFIPVANALTQLLPGIVEVVIHDLATSKVMHIENSFSPRKVGDDSLLATVNYAQELNGTKTIGPYRKSNSDGSMLKSVSTLIESDEGDPIGLLCINLRVDALDMAAQLLQNMSSISSNLECNTILKNDWREVANATIASVMKTRKITLSQSKREDRRHIVNKLAAADIFEARGSVEYVADALGISRAYVYDLLKQSRATT